MQDPRIKRIRRELAWEGMIQLKSYENSYSGELEEFVEGSQSELQSDKIQRFLVALGIMTHRTSKDYIVNATLFGMRKSCVSASKEPAGNSLLATLL